MKTSSWGLDSLTKSTAAVSTLERSSCMLPLLSTIMPSDTGTSSRRNNLMGCSAPFSKTLNDSCERLVTSFPLLSDTLTGRTTNRASVRKVGASSLAAGGLAGGVWAAAKKPKSTRLLSRRIVSKSVKGLERRQTARLNQLHVHAPILSIASNVFRRIIQHVLISQLHADFSGDIRQLSDVLHRKRTPAGLFRHLIQEAGPHHLFRRAPTA